MYIKATMSHKNIYQSNIFAKKFVYISKLHTRSQAGPGLDLGR